MLTRLVTPIVLTALFIGVSGCASAPAVSETPLEPSFEAQTIDDGVGVGYGLAIGDLDGDSDPDILLADESEIVWYRNGDWQRFVMAENLTERDNVAIAAEDINGDGMVEVAVGAQWNPGNTSDAAASGAVIYLIRPDDPTGTWEPVTLPHDPTTHRMRWVRLADGRYSLVVLPLHGVGNRGGEGDGSRVQAYIMPENPRDPWETIVLDESMNQTHNLEVVPAPGGSSDRIFVGGRQGAISITPQNGQWAENAAARIPGMDQGIGEIRHGSLGDTEFLATIEPMHGTDVVVYTLGDQTQRHQLAAGFAEGHGLAVADLLGLGRDQVVAGWRNPDANDEVGIRLFVPTDETGTNWETHVIDDNNMAVEDLKVADLDGDGRPEIIAAGRATNNLIIYWNKSE